MYTKALFVSILALLTSCKGFDPESLGVDAQDNAFQCITLHLDGPMTESTGDTQRFEMPASVDLKGLSPESMTAISDMAERMGC